MKDLLNPPIHLRISLATPLESTLADVFILNSLNLFRISVDLERSHFAQFLCNVSPFRINTSRSVSKQATLSTFGINTYEKQAGWGRGAIAKQLFRRSASRNELVCFQALAHSFPRRRSVNSFHFNNFRTLSAATEGVHTALLTLASRSSIGRSLRTRRSRFGRDGLNVSSRVANPDPYLPLLPIPPLAGVCEPAWMSLPFNFQLSTVNRRSRPCRDLLSAALPRVTEHGSQGTGHGLCFSLPRYLLTSLPLGAHRAPLATLFHPWLANASANTSSPISTGAKKSRAPFGFRRTPPSLCRGTTSTAGSKLVQDTVK